MNTVPSSPASPENQCQNTFETPSPKKKFSPRDSAKKKTPTPTPTPKRTPKSLSPMGSSKKSRRCGTSNGCESYKVLKYRNDGSDKCRRLFSKMYYIGRSKCIELAGCIYNVRQSIDHMETLVTKIEKICSDNVARSEADPTLVAEIIQID